MKKLFAIAVFSCLVMALRAALIEKRRVLGARDKAGERLEYGKLDKQLSAVTRSIVLYWGVALLFYCTT